MTLGLAKIVVTYGAPRKQKRCLLQFMLFAAAVVALSLAGATPAFAQCTDSWTGNAGDKLWTDGGNWSTGSQPGGSDSACLQTAGASVSMDVSDAVANLTVGTGDTLQISNGGTYSNLRLDGSSIVNNGSIVLPGSTVFGSSLSIGSGNTVTLSGTGAINLVISTVTIAGYGNPSTLINQSTIQGTGFVGYAGVSINNTASGVINANSSGNPLTIGRNGNNTNTGVFKATNGGQFVFGSAALNNVGGTIEAIGANSSASFTAQGQGGQTITGGTFTTSGGGVIYSNQSTLIDGTGGNTVTNNGTMIIPPSGNHPGSSF